MVADGLVDLKHHLVGREHEVHVSRRTVGCLEQGDGLARHALRAGVEAEEVEHLCATLADRTATAAEAQATLRSSWRVNKAVDGRVSLALSVTLFDPSGRRLLSTDSGTALSANFWNDSTVRRAIEQALARLPRPEPSPSAGK